MGRLARFIYYFTTDGNIPKPPQPSYQTLTGKIISFIAKRVDAIKSLKVGIEPVQDLHGQDAPYPPGGGKNLLNPSAIEQGSFNGTTGAMTASITRCRFNAPFFVQAGTYTLSDSDGFDKAIYVYDIDGNFLPSETNTAWSSANITKTFAGDRKINIVWRFTDNREMYPSDIKTAMLESGSSATAYAPYENICPISGWTGATVYDNGVNQWDEEWELGNISNTTGANVNANDRIRSKNYIPICPNTAYYFKTPDTLGLRWYDRNKTFLSAESTGLDVKTSPANAYYLRFVLLRTTEYGNDVSINYPSTDHDYHAYSGTFVFLTFGQTVYGGTASDNGDGTWTVVATLAGVDMGILSYVLTNAGVFRSNIGAKSVSDNLQHGLTSIYPFAGTRFSASMPDKTWMMDADGRFHVNDSSYADAATFKAAMVGQTLVYELAEPITFTVSGETLSSLVGQNNMWADSGDVTATVQTN